MRVLVVGSGIFGLCTALECVNRGMEVTIVDAGSIPCASASSHDLHRLIRHPYGRLTGYGRLVPDAFRCWDRLFSEIDEVLYHETGTLAIGDPTTRWIEHSAATLNETGVEFETLTPPAARERFPFLAIGNDKDVLFTSTGGVLLADRILRALAALLQTGGAHLQPGITVTSDGLADLATGMRANVVVIATGAWTVLPSAVCDYPVTPTRQVVGYLHDPPEEFVGDGVGRCPMILDLDETSGFYLVPSVSGTPAKIGDHLPGRSDIAEPTGEPDPSEQDRIIRLIRTVLVPSVPPDLTFGLCRYAMTPDRRFILRMGKRLSGLPDIGVLVTGGGSGHGFKFGPLMGRLVADVIEGSMDADEAGRIAAGRIGPEPLLPYLR